MLPRGSDSRHGWTVRDTVGALMLAEQAHLLPLATKKVGLRLPVNSSLVLHEWRKDIVIVPQIHGSLKLD